MERGDEERGVVIGEQEEGGGGIQEWGEKRGGDSNEEENGKKGRGEVEIGKQEQEGEISKEER